MHWLWVLWFGYTWPSLKGNGPEAIVQTVVYFILAVVLIPPFRRFLKAEFDKIHAKFGHHEEILHHIVFHSPDIPNLPGTKPLADDSEAVQSNVAGSPRSEAH